MGGAEYVNVHLESQKQLVACMQNIKLSTVLHSQACNLSFSRVKVLMFTRSMVCFAWRQHHRDTYGKMCMTYGLNIVVNTMAPYFLW